MSRYREIRELPPRLYAVGDIHGCHLEVAALLDFLQSSEHLSKSDLVLFIGDYIDRGGNSREVLDLLLKFRAEYPQTIFLRGNHEDMLLSFLNSRGPQGNAYLSNGGAEFAASYGVDPSSAAELLREELKKAVPKEHLDFLQTLEHYVLAGDYVFAHAGLNPLRDLRAQVETDLFWIREEFIGNLHYFKRTVVFGHTPYEDILFHLPYKIGIDTGLVYGNMLSCIEVQQGKIFQLKAGGGSVKTSSFPERPSSL